MLRCPTTSVRRTAPGWALVGDAGYHRDAVTGHGISDAYRDAELLAVALDEALRGEADEAPPSPATRRRGTGRFGEIFDLTCALAAYPPVPEFVELRSGSAVAIDTEAAALAARSPLFPARAPARPPSSTEGEPP